MLTKRSIGYDCSLVEILESLNFKLEMSFLSIILPFQLRVC
jgi:hypothetical protein